LHAETKQRNDSAEQNGRENSANDAVQRIHLCDPARVTAPNTTAASSLALGPPRRTCRDRVKLGSRSSVGRSVVNWQKECQRKVETIGCGCCEGGAVQGPAGAPG
jgi:hypothetical protein